MDQKTFKLIMDSMEKAAKDIVDKNVNMISYDRDSRKRIESEYNKLRDYTKVSYMQNSDSLLDRHKVCACLILSIVKSKPLVYDQSSSPESVRIYNENLAMRVGLTLLSKFLQKNKDTTIDWTKGFDFPITDPSRGVSYQELLCLMLYYDIIYDQYSILAISNILYMIEEYTKLKHTIS